MQKSIFKRYLRVTMIIVVLSFIMLGSVMMVFFSQYWRDEKKGLLEQNVTSVATVAGRAFMMDQSGILEESGEFLNVLLANYSQNIDADIFICDLDGNILFGSFEGGKTEDRNQISLDIIGEASKGRYSEKGTLGGFFDSQFFTVAVPLYAGGNSEEICAGVVLASTSASPINSIFNEMLQIYFVAAVLALTVTFFVVGAFSYNMVKPLRQMSVAVKCFGEGDFSVRVPVSSEDELGQLSRSFNEMANSLSNSEGMRRSFIANVSHELKTPMTTIAGFIDGILDGTIPENERNKYLRIVSKEVKRLSRLVKSMLDLSRIDSGEMHIQPKLFNFTNTLFTTLLTFEQVIEDKNIEIRGLEKTGAQTVFGDQDLLHQVVYNLIENAVKFTNKNGHISFAISDSIDRTSVVIENSGVGINAEEMPMIFDRFYKIDKSRSRDKNGMGLGLYIVRTIIKLHGGEITVDSELNKFCRFEFYIPKRNQENIPRTKDNTARLRENKNRNSSQYDVFDAEIVEDTSAMSLEDTEGGEEKE